MQIAEKFDVSTLTWIKGEIDETLKQARIALEAYVEDPNDESQLRFCVTYLHQVRGTLQMVELFGAAQFATEMEQLALTLQTKSAAEEESGYEILMRAILQLPDYLEALQAGQPDNPILLLPLMNEMRHQRSQEPLAELAFFRPDLSVAPPPAGPAATKVDIGALTKKVRPYLQSGLVHLIKGQNVDKALQTIGSVIDKLLQVAKSDPLRQFLWVNGAFVEGLADRGIEQTATNKQLLGKLDQMAKILETKGEAGLSKDVLANIVRVLLLQVGKADSNGSKVSQVRSAFRLDTMVVRAEDLGAMRGFNADLKRTVSADIMDELARVKDSLDIFVRSDRSDVASIAPLADSMAIMGDTLGMIREEKLQAKLREQVAVIRQMVKGELPTDDDNLMGVAGALLSVESALKDWGTLTPVEQADLEEGEEEEAASHAPEADAEHRRIVGQVMKEARDDLIKIREAISVYLGNPSDKSAVQAVPEWLQRITGSLVMLSYKRVAQVLRAVNLYLNTAVLHAESVPPTDELDSLADVIMSVEYYLEAFIENRVHPASVLEVAEQAIAKLGYSVDKLAEIPARSEEELPTTAIELDEAEAQEEAEEAVQEPEAFEIEAAVEVPEGEGEEAVEETVAESAEAEEEVVEVDLSETEAGPEPAPAAAAPAEAPRPEVDEEILEIFVEEAGEQIEAITEYLPRWIDNQGDVEALGDLRRAYHTLKGSGRLVGAVILGEFSWAFENMLNRVIDGTLKPNATVFDMLQQALDALPELVEEFKSGKTPSTDYQVLQEMAHEVTTPGGAKPAAVPSKPAEQAAEMQAKPLEAKPIEIPELDPVLLEIYANEADSHLETVNNFVENYRQNAKRRVDEPLIRALHTLTGSSRMAGVMGVAEISSTLERYAKNLQASNTPIGDEAVNALDDMVGFIRAMLEYLEDRSKPAPDNTALVDQVNALYATVEHLEEQAAAAPEGGLATQPEEAVEVEQPSAEAEAEEISFEATPAPEEEIEEISFEAVPAPDEEVEEISFEAVLAPEEEIEEITFETVPAPEEEVEEISFEAAPAPEEEVEEISLEAPAPSEVEEGFYPRVSELPEYDADLVDIFLEEGKEIIDSSEETLQAWVDNPSDISHVRELERQLHTLKGSARMAGIAAVGDLAHSLESTFEAMVEGRLSRSREMTGLLQLAHDRLVEMLEQVRADRPVHSGQDIIERIHDLGKAPQEETAELEEITPPVEQTSEVPSQPTSVPSEGEVRYHPRLSEQADYDADLVSIFLEEGQEILDQSEQTLQSWVDNPDDISLARTLQRQLHTLKGGARMAGITPIGDLSHILESTFEAMVEGRMARDKRMTDILQLSHDRLVEMLDQVRNDQPIRAADDLIALVENPDLPKLEAELAAEEEAHTEEGVAAEELADETLTHGAIDVSKQAIAKLVEVGPKHLSELTSSLKAWESNREDDVAFGRIQRDLHLLRLDAHAANIQAIGDIVDRTANLFNRIKNGQLALKELMFSLVEQAFEELTAQVGVLSKGQMPEAAENLLRELDDTLGVERKATPTTVEAKQEIEEEQAEADEHERRRRDRPQYETTRVRADLLDNMVNYAGEISIYRARIEQEIGSFRGTMAEMDQTIERIREQLRKFDIETEAQIQSRYDEAQGYEDFDPLEFDRFTTMQQISRSMMESLSDLTSLREILLGTIREAETLLLQQSRVNTELQEALVRTRMVPLVENAPRLRRIVRQTCAELHKKAVLRFHGAEVEMDRNVVEHMLAPLEHLLRNAIAHGIEPPAERVSKGKPDEGTIIVAQAKEGSEVVIRVIDDGAGLDIEAIKTKAIARGLMKPNSRLSDKEIMRFIFESGFSTAQSLSQISGRGVGMDVVASEVKQLGGVVEIESRPGEGSTFIARLPLTLAVSRALLVSAAEDVYAIPLLGIQSIERIDPQQLRDLLADERPVYQWLGQDYELLALNSVLGLGQANLSSEAKQPLLLARSGDHRVAMILDGLLGSREVVVKSLGPQLSNMQELAGATILADGSVGLILDLPALIRKGMAQREQLGGEIIEEVATETRREPVVMVVDDSITVRKVTERLLARNHFKSVTAKDGVDALGVLEEIIPDVMLLDIEMPRMDGYELATHIRNSDRLKDIPIIMITSRTGEKHRQRAMDIGVNAYMGKPYTEADLLDHISKLLGRTED